MEEGRQRRQSERRRLWDRRAPDLRRSGERRRLDRRSGSFEGPAERRRGDDRRRADRRDAHDRRSVMGRRRGRRRRETPTPFSVEEMESLRERFAVTGPVACPACGSAFTLGPGRKRGNGEIARRVMCLGCGRSAVVSTQAARVLVVDGVRDRRSALQALLASAGHEVVETADAGVALHAYQAVPADVVFIDVAITGRMEAPEFLRRLRRVFPDARVVAMAARPSYSGAFDAGAVMKGHGAARTIRMPLSRDDVLRTVEEVRP